tara:strand:- start:138 stop:332 length:195 start_codon:yes stop_codon:yes gene_type:complete
MDLFFSRKRYCLFNTKKGTEKGLIIGEHTESGGKEDGQEYIIIEAIKTQKIKHIKKEDVLEIIE